MKKLLTVALASVLGVAAVSANAAQAGTYAGVGAGLTRYSGVSAAKNTAAGRLFAGYNFNKTYGVEVGVASTTNAVSKATDAGVTAKEKVRETLFDVAGKAHYEVAPKVDVYGLGGLALVHQNVEDSVSAASFASVATKDGNYVRPELGAGVSYEVTKQVSVAGEYRYVFGNNGPFKSHFKNTPSLHMALVSLNYNFG